jgi:hypothetical protein
MNDTITVRVSQKGALSVYGLGRFPVTLYAEQWERLLSLDNLTILRGGLNLPGLNRKTEKNAGTHATT